MIFQHQDNKIVIKLQEKPLGHRTIDFMLSDDNLYYQDIKHRVDALKLKIE